MRKWNVVLGCAVLGGALGSGGCVAEMVKRRDAAPNANVEPARPEPIRASFAPAAPPPAAAATNFAAEPTAETPARTAAPARPVFKPFQSNRINPRAGLATPPRTTPKAAPKAAPAAGGDYEVQSGDTVSGIARAHGVGVAALMTANNLSEDSARKLRVGRKLVIPGGAAVSGTVAAAKPTPTTTETAAPEAAPPVAAAPETTPAETTMTTTAPAETPAATAAQSETFTGEVVIVEVEKDTTLEAYARERGFKPAVLRQLNKDMISDENLKAGQILFVPES